jgi:hypothetical protein
MGNMNEYRSTDYLPQGLLYHDEGGSEIRGFNFLSGSKDIVQKTLAILYGSELRRTIITYTVPFYEFQESCGMGPVHADELLELNPGIYNTNRNVLTPMFCQNVDGSQCNTLRLSG